jgi:hypothetical protein
MACELATGEAAALLPAQAQAMIGSSAIEAAYSLRRPKFASGDAAPGAARGARPAAPKASGPAAATVAISAASVPKR